MEIIPLQIASYPLSRYEKIWKIQKATQEALISGNGIEALILCEHYPVITLGRSANTDNIVASSAKLAEQNVSVLTVERGGDVTYHGPGQLVAYPIIDLRKRKTDVGWYIRGLEQIIIQTLAQFGITGEIREGKTGVWVAQSKKSSEFSKIASIGIRISRWCTLHGVSINREDVSQGFSLIHGCGFPELSVTSLEQELRSKVSSEDLRKIFIESFCSFFDYLAVWEDKISSP